MNRAEAFTIKETSEQTGLSGDTIRYYEKIGLLPRAERRENRHRVYRTEDIATIKLVTCLKKTGMSLDEMKPFLNMSSLDDVNASPELYDRIESHKESIKSQIASLQTIIDFIDSKMLLGSQVGRACSESEDDTAQSVVQSHFFK